MPTPIAGRIETVNGTAPARKATRKKILFVGHSAFQGGAELCLDTLLKYIDRSRYDVRTVFPWQGPMTESARHMGIPVEIVPLTWWMNWPRGLWYYKNLLSQALPNVFRLVRIIRKHRIELVYTNTVAIWESALASRLARVPHVWHCHEVLGPGSTEHHLLPLWLHYRLIDGLSRRIIFESESSRKACHVFREQAKSVVVYNSLRFEPEAPDAPRQTDRQSFGLTSEDRVVAFVGQLNERKNPFALLRAVARIRHLDRLRCLFVGSGPLREALEKEIRKLGLDQICSVLDFQPDIRGLMRSMDVLVLPSREESFGLVLVEAAAFGKPVIATRTQGPTEIVAEGETGYLVGVDDDAQLADRIAALLNDEAERRRMGSAAQHRVRQLFSAERNTRKVQEVIEDVLN